MKAYALGRGVPERQLLIEDKSCTTVGNLYYAKLELERLVSTTTREFEKEKLRRIIIGTDDIHLLKVYFFATKIFGSDYRIYFYGFWPRGLNTHRMDGIIKQDLGDFQELWPKLWQSPDGDHEAFVRMFKQAKAYKFV